MFRYLTKGELVQINKRSVALSGDPHSVENPANLDFVLEMVQTKYELDAKGRPKSNDEKLLLKASFMLSQFAATAHAFAEGNKRTAITATISFLSFNGYYYKPLSMEKDQDELVEFVREVALGKHSLTKISKWLKPRIAKVLPQDEARLIKELREEQRRINRKLEYRLRSKPKHRQKKAEDRLFLQSEALNQKLNAILGLKINSIIAFLGSLPKNLCTSSA